MSNNKRKYNKDKKKNKKYILTDEDFDKVADILNNCEPWR